jgi:hypothetical protein
VNVTVNAPFTKLKVYLADARVPWLGTIGYEPGRLVATAVVVTLGLPVTAVANVSPLTNPLYLTIRVGFAKP